MIGQYEKIEPIRTLLAKGVILEKVCIGDILRKRDSYIKDVLCLVCFRFLLKGGKTMKIIKKINTSAAIALDSMGREIVVFGKGIGFPAVPYELEDLSLIERTFTMWNRNIGE